MATCTICGDELHPERAEKYDYCTKRSCRERAAKALPIASVGVNKAADQFVVLADRTEQEMARGRFKKEPEASGSPRRPRTPATHAKRPVPELVPRSSARPPRPGGPPAPRPGPGVRDGARRGSGWRSPTEPWG